MMAVFLSQDWLDVQRSLGATLPPRPGATACVRIVVTGTPTGEVSYVQAIEDGRLVGTALGSDDDVEATLTQTYADAVAIASSELDASVAFMQGRVKVVGDMGRLMAIMPLIQSPEYKAMLAELAAQTEM